MKSRSIMLIRYGKPHPYFVKEIKMVNWALESEAKAALDKDGMLLKEAPESIKKNYRLLVKAIQQNPDSLQYASPEYRQDYCLIRTAFEKDTSSLRYAEGRFLDDSYYMTKCIKADGMALEYASNRLKEDDNFVKTAILKTPKSIQFASERLKKNKELAYSLLLTKKDSSFIEFFSDEVKDDDRIVMKTLQLNPKMLSKVNVRFRRDPVLLLKLMKINPALFALHELNPEQELAFYLRYNLKHKHQTLEELKDVILW